MGSRAPAHMLRGMWNLPTGSNPYPLHWQEDSHSLCVCAKSLQPCLTLYNAMDRSPPGSSGHGILQARILKVALPTREVQDILFNSEILTAWSFWPSQVFIHSKGFPLGIPATKGPSPPNDPHHILTLSPRPSLFDPIFDFILNLHRIPDPQPCLDPTFLLQ